MASAVVFVIALAKQVIQVGLELTLTHISVPSLLPKQKNPNYIRPPKKEQ